MMNVGRLTRLVRYFGTGVLDQVLLSGASFIAGFIMIRYTSDLNYGQYVLAQSAVLLIMSAQGAWLTGPLAAIAPKKSPETKRMMIGAVRASQARFVRRVAIGLLAAAAAGNAVGLWGAQAAVVAGAAIFAGWATLRREYLRSVLVIYSKPEWVLRADLAYVVVLISGISLAAYLDHWAGVCAIVALVFATGAGATAAHRIFAADPGWGSGDAMPFWKEMRPLAVWATVGAVVYWLFAQSYNYILAERLDLTAVTNVNAARLVLMPVFVFTMGINNLLMPVAANWLAQFELASMLRRLGLLALGITALDLIYFGLAWTFRDWLVGDLLHKSIGDRDRLLILWACIALIFLLREVLQAALFALRQVRSMAWLMGLSAIVSLSLMWTGINWWGAAAVLIGQIAGECVNLAGLTLLLWGRIKSKR
jgi:O-antigen/teichoic acid export membrane protein